MYYLPTPCLVFFFIFSLFSSLSCASSKQDFGWCEAQFQCGNITAGFPFWGGNRPEHCGHPSLELHCNKSSSTSLIISDQEYSVLHLNQTSNTLTLARPDLLGSFCSSTFTNTTLPPRIFELLPTYKSVTVFYNCNSSLSYLSSYTCPAIGPISVSENPEYHGTCNASFTVNVPTSFVTKERKLNMTNLENVLRKGFEVKVVIDEKACQECASSHGRCGFNETGFNETLTSEIKCRPIRPLNDSGGACGYNQTSRRFVCYCKFEPYSLSCHHTGHLRAIIIGTVSILIIIVFIACVLACFFGKYKKPQGG